MTVKEKVSQFVNAKLQNFKNVINKGLNTSPEAIKYAPTQFTGLVPELAAKAKLPKPIQKWAETPSNLTSKVPWYSPNLKPYSMIADLGVNLAKGMVFGDINTNKVSMPAYRKLSSGTPFNKLSGEEQLALNTAQENAKLNFGGMVAGPKATNFKALPKITGAFDNLPRAEISDLSSRVKGNFIDIITNLTKKGETPVLADVMGHDSLYKSYPQLKLMKIELDPTYVAQDMRGSFNPQTNSIKVNPTLSKGTFRSTLLHEVQHAVQEIEGFAKGASPDSMRPQELADQMVKAQLDFFKNPTPENRQTWKSLESALNSKKHPNALYRQVAGELEARSTQLREGMGTTQRKAINPYDQILQKEGINRADVIVNKGGGESLNATDDLVKEARKYKSAEEFVKAQGETVFRGTQEGGLLKESMDTDYGPGFYFANKKSTAEGYGNNIEGYRVKLTNPFMVKNRYEMNKVFDEAIANNNKGNIQDYLKAKGYDGIKVEDGGLAGDEGVGGFTIVFDKKNIQSFLESNKNKDPITEIQQLTDIWNKAQSSDMLSVGKAKVKVGGKQAEAQQFLDSWKDSYLYKTAKNKSPLNLNSDGSITLIHRTTPEGLKAIEERGFKKGTYFGTNDNTAIQRPAGTAEPTEVIKIKVNPKDLAFGKYAVASDNLTKGSGDVYSVSGKAKLKVKGNNDFYHGTNNPDSIRRNGFSVSKEFQEDSSFLGDNLVEGIHLSRSRKPYMEGGQLEDVAEVLKVSADAKNILKTDMKGIGKLYTKYGIDELSGNASQKLTQALKKAGYDGIEYADEVVIFDPSKVKLNQSKVGVKPTEGQELAKQKLNDLMNYTNRLVNEKGLSPQQAQKIGFKKGMDILEGRATADIQPKALPKVGGVLKTTSPELQKPLQQATKPNALSPQTAQINPAERKVLQGGKVVQPLEEIIQRTPTLLKNKVGIIDYLRTPDKVLKKIGLANEAEQLKTSYNSYLDELPKEIGKITDWYNQAKSPESATKIFKRLDGQYADLNPTETKIANEIKAYLDKWADRLELPKDKRITNYITHIFDDQLIKKEFDEDLAKLIQDNVAGSVYDPFTQQRLGKLGYKENVWDALDAYVKRAVRKVNMDPALEQVKKASDHLETSQFNYVKSYIDRINMRPTEIDNLLDNSIKQLVGYRFGARPTANITRIGRQMVYRGTLGLNVGSSLRNLTQGVNTYSELGEKYTLIGYTNLMRKGTKELELNGILRNNMIEDRALNATKKFWEKADKALFYLFESVEKINRGAAYFGAKAKALKNGATEQQAIEYGRTIVRKTQFTFGKVDTPVALQSDIVKLFSQFQSYNLKQMEFVGGMIKAKDVAGLARYTIGSLVVLETVGKLLGMDWKDLIPSIRIGVPPTITAPIEIGKAATGGKDKYGNELTPEERLKNAGGALIPFAPGGVQIKKTVGGIGDVSRGYAQTGSGNVKYPVAQTPTNAVRGALFGGYNLPEAEANRKDDIAPLSPKQSKSFIDSGKKQSTYDVIIQRRMQTALETKIKAIAKQVTAGELTQSEGREQMREVVDEKTIYESSSDAPKNIVSKVALYGQSLIADPSFTFEAVVEGNPLRKMSGDATVLERQKYLGTLDAGNTKTEVDHVIPLSLGGTNEDSNLQILRSEENALKASYELELLSQLKSGEINKKQAQNLILDWKSHVDLTLLPAIAEELAKATKTTKTKAKVKTTKKLKAAKLPKLKKYKSKKIKLAKVKVSSLKNFTYLPKLKAPSGVSQKTLDELRHPRV